MVLLMMPQTSDEYAATTALAGVTVPSMRKQRDPFQAKWVHKGDWMQFRAQSAPVEGTAAKLSSLKVQA